jgi:DNA-binding transcriptional regulator/RsmH inhibitor MraZ
MRRATVGEQVTLLGIQDHIEIWPTDEWRSRLERALPGYGDTLYEAAERPKAEIAGNQK